jgi:hypothetical protein
MDAVSGVEQAGPATGPSTGSVARADSRGAFRWWLGQARAPPAATVGALVVLMWVLIAIFAPLISP